MHPTVVNEAVKYDRHVDLPMWMSSLSLEDNQVPFYQQKELECAEIETLMNPQVGSVPGAMGEPRKRGPRMSVFSLEKRILKQKQKDQKEV